jgi:hypothetical protein
MDILLSKFKRRARHHIPVLALVVTDHIDEAVDALENYPGPAPPVKALYSLMPKICGSSYDFSIYHSDDFNDKTHVLITVMLFHHLPLREI